MFRMFLESQVRVPQAEVREKGYDNKPVMFATGKPVTFNYMFNPVPAPDFGERFGQHVEPRGKYLLHNTHSEPGSHQGWQYGVTTLKHPLVMPFGLFQSDMEGLYGPNGWKNILFQAYGVGGSTLTQALQSEGYDGIVTIWMQGTQPAYTKEIVDFDYQKYRPSRQ